MSHFTVIIFLSQWKYAAALPGAQTTRLPETQPADVMGLFVYGTFHVSTRLVAVFLFFHV